MGYTELNKCLACGGEDLNLVLDLDFQPPANSFTRRPEDKLPRYPLQTMFCKACSHTQLSVAVDPAELFRDYIYVTGTSAWLTDHLSRFAYDWVDSQTKVLDIGCNDGTLMRAVIEEGGEAWGVDPALNLEKEQEGLNVIREFWGPEVLPKLPHMFDYITAFNSFAHNPDPLMFLQTTKEALRPGGRIVIEMPYAPKTFGLLQFDQVYHEHYNYFSVRSMRTLVDRAGLQLHRVEPTQMQGGSMRYFIGHKRPKESSSADLWVAHERDSDYNWYSTHKGYAEAARKTIDKLEHELIEWDKAGYYCIAYGASAKFSVVTNAFKRHQDCPINMVLDDNRLKQGRYTPGLGIIVHSPEIVREIGSNLLVLCGAANIKEELSAKLRALRPGAEGDMLMTWWGEGVKVEKL